jgi:hypothetical protein
MNTERQAKISLLSRASRGKLILPNYLAELSSAIGTEVTPAMLTGLEERDRLFEQFRKGYQEVKTLDAITFSKTYTREEKDSVLAATSRLAERLNEAVFLLTKRSETCGAVRLNGDRLLRHCDAILALDGDSVMVLSRDLTQALLLDYTSDDPESSYELTVWGNTWPLKQAR